VSGFSLVFGSDFPYFSPKTEISSSRVWGLLRGFALQASLAKHRKPESLPTAEISGVWAYIPDFGCGGAVLDHPHRPKEPGAEGDYYGNVQKEATFRTMWQVNAEAKEPGQPGRAKIACRKISEDEPFATVHAEIDFSADLIAFSESASHGGALEAKVVAVAKRHSSQPFTMRNLTDSVTGGHATCASRQTDSSSAASSGRPDRRNAAGRSCFIGISARTHSRTHSKSAESASQRESASPKGGTHSLSTLGTLECVRVRPSASGTHSPGKLGVRRFLPSLPRRLYGRRPGDGRRFACDAGLRQ
jgi:hypothetical protein